MKTFVNTKKGAFNVFDKEDQVIDRKLALRGFTHLDNKYLGRRTVPWDYTCV